MSLPITDASQVELNFAIRLHDGKEVDNNFEQAPCTFEYGDGNLLPGFEKVLLGMVAGQRAQHQIEPADAFGDWLEDRCQQFSRKQFDGLELEEGLIMSFADPSGERPGVIKQIEEESVTVDFNHPLAGHTLEFDVLIHSVKPKA